MNRPPLNALFSQFFQKLLWNHIQSLSHWLLRRRGLFLRTLLCWVISLILFPADDRDHFDTHFQMRGPQPKNSQIVLINLRLNDIISLKATSSASGFFSKEISESIDSSFWDKNIWKNLLENILIQNPRSIGVSFYFSENILSVENLSPSDFTLFNHPKIFWAASTIPGEISQFPIFGYNSKENVGTNILPRDDDGVFRRVYPNQTDLFHLAEKTTGIRFPNESNLMINFRDAAGGFPVYQLIDILQGRITDPHFFENKIVLIGPEISRGSLLRTPLGNMQRSEILAHISDNLLEQRWIYKLNFPSYSFILLGLVLVCIYIITTFPQSIAATMIFFVAIFWTASAVWLFDVWYIWIPLQTGLLMIMTTWLIFINYQVSRMERKNWALKQEQKYLHDLEQLKNNFVSLISHDLKTPIAKIQAIVDRLILQNPESSTFKDYVSLRKSSDELNKYIQSVLQVLRVESRDFKLNKESCDINEIIENVLQQLSELASDKSIEMDSQLMKEVLLNLIENAIKYSEKNKIIKITSKDFGDQISVSIQDQGYGISKEDLPYIWGKFVRGKDEDLRSRGTGLGLYLVKYFIELHGGSIQIDSQVGKGTLVKLYLPISHDVEATSVIIPGGSDE